MTDTYTTDDPSTTVVLPVDRSNSLSDLAAAIREARAAVVDALSGAVEHAIRCGNILTDAKKQTGHGRWGEFLRACDLGERQAQRYMRLALLAEQSRLAKSDLAGMTIEGAIKRLAPPRAALKSATPATAPKQTSKPKPSGNPRKRVTHLDIVEVWIAAPLESRAKAIDDIGLTALLAAIPEDWWPLIEKRLTERNAPPTPTRKADPPLFPSDGGIPPCLLRQKAKPKPQDDVAVSAELMKAKFAAPDAGAGR